MYRTDQQPPRDLDPTNENLYLYGDNNPLNVTDPSGLDSERLIPPVEIPRLPWEPPPFRVGPIPPVMMPELYWPEGGGGPITPKPVMGPRADDLFLITIKAPIAAPGDFPAVPFSRSTTRIEVLGPFELSGPDQWEEFFAQLPGRVGSKLPRLPQTDVKTLTPIHGVPLTPREYQNLVKGVGLDAFYSAFYIDRSYFSKKELQIYMGGGSLVALSVYQLSPHGLKNAMPTPRFNTTICELPQNWGNIIITGGFEGLTPPFSFNANQGILIKRRSLFLGVGNKLTIEGGRRVDFNLPNLTGGGSW